MSAFFDSRWVPCPEHVVDAGDEGGLPRGFRAGAAAAAIKTEGLLDVGLLVCDAPETVSAVRFTRSGVLAAPVLVTRDHARNDALRVVVANAGNANAATGAPGMEVALAMQRAAGAATGVPADQVAVNSTGVIGVALDAERVARGIAQASRSLHEHGDVDLARAIMTTDAFSKRASLDVTLPSGEVRLSAQAKGAGMIEPAFATMLCFVQTDAQLAPETADLLLGVCVKRSFDRISVDGQLSTNDTVILQCSGESGVHVAPASDDERQLGLALDALLRQLALLIVRDGEGARADRPRRRPRRRPGRRRALCARGRELAAREDRAVRRRPELGAHRAVRRQGDGWAGSVSTAAGPRHRDRGDRAVSRRRGGALRRGGRERGRRRP